MTEKKLPFLAATVHQLITLFRLIILSLFSPVCTTHFLDLIVDGVLQCQNEIFIVFSIVGTVTVEGHRKLDARKLVG